MTKNWRKFLALLCALILVCCEIPVLAAAEKAPAQAAEEVKKAAHFEEGYVRIPAGTVVYTAANAKKVKGTVTADAYAYAKSSKKNAKSPKKDWIEVRFDTKDGKKIKAYVQVSAVKTLSSKQQKKLQKELKAQKARKLSGKYVPVAEYKAGKVKKDKKAEDVQEEATPAAVSNVKLTKSAKEDRVKVSWKKVKNVKYYRVYYKKASSSKYSYKKVAASKTSTTIKVTGTKKHNVYVKAYLKNGKTTKSSVKSITPYWYYVYIVGEADFNGKLGCADLKSPRYDLPALKKVFSKQTSKGGKIKTALNASKSAIYSGIKSVLGAGGPNSVAVFAIICHGYVRSGDYLAGTLCCTDGNTIRPAELKSYMDSNVKSKHVVIMLGSCGSGAFIHHTWEANEEAPTAASAARTFTSSFVNAFRSGASSNAGEFKGSTKYTVIAGAEVDESGWETWWKYSSGVVANARNNPIHALVRAGGYEYCNDSAQDVGWIGKQGDANGDKKISVKEAYNYAYKLVVNATYSSHMQFWSSEPNLILFQ